MKTQEIYSVVVTENINVKDAKTGQIEKVRKNILYTANIAAYTEASARVIAVSHVDPDKVDIDEVEVLVRPFCG